MKPMRMSGPVIWPTLCWRLVFLMCWYVPLSAVGWALDPAKLPTQYVLTMWGAEQGLPQSSVFAVLQTRDGYLWLGTEEGLVRFDGVRFEVFDQHNSKLKNSYVHALCETRDGSLWIGTWGGGLAQYKDGQFTNYTQEDGLLLNQIRVLTEGRDGSLWIGTEGGGLNRFYQGKFSRPLEARLLPSGFIRALHEDNAGNLWVGTSAGVLRWQSQESHVYTTANGLPDVSVRAIYEDACGQIWIGTALGCALWQGETFKAYRAGKELPRELRAVTRILEDAQQNLWLATYGAGLLRYQGGKFTVWAPGPSGPGERLESLFEDREHNLWFGGIGAGLSKLTDPKIAMVGKPEGLSHDYIGPIYETRDGTLWVGTFGGGLNRWRNGRPEAVPGSPSKETILAMCESADGSLWVGTNQGELKRFKDGRFTSWRMGHDSRTGQLAAIAEGPDGALWLGSYHLGLQRFKDGVFTPIKPGHEMMTDTVYTLKWDRQGVLWIGTNRGLVRYQNGEFTKYGKSEGVPEVAVNCILEDARGRLWLGTSGAGLILLQQGRGLALTEQQGLFDGTLWALQDDGVGSLWMSSNKGIARVRWRDLENYVTGRAARVSTDVFGKADGMRNRECNGQITPPSFRTHDGKLWFSTVQGVAMLDPAQIDENLTPPPVVIDATNDAGGGIEYIAGMAAGTCDLFAVDIMPDNVRHGALRP